MVAGASRTVDTVWVHNGYATRRHLYHQRLRGVVDGGVYYQPGKKKAHDGQGLNVDWSELINGPKVFEIVPRNDTSSNPAGSGWGAHPPVQQDTDVPSRISHLR